jgi:hypothetical protein
MRGRRTAILLPEKEKAKNSISNVSVANQSGEEDVAVIQRRLGVVPSAN